MYMYTNICMYKYTYIQFLHQYTYTYVHIYIPYICWYVRLQGHIYTYVHICAYTLFHHIYIYTYAHIYVCICRFPDQCWFQLIPPDALVLLGAVPAEGQHATPPEPPPAAATGDVSVRPSRGPGVTGSQIGGAVGVMFLCVSGCGDVNTFDKFGYGPLERYYIFKDIKIMTGAAPPRRNVKADMSRQ